MGSTNFLKKSKQTAEISWHFFEILVQQKRVLTEIALEFSEKSKNTIFKALSSKKNSGFFPGPWIPEIFPGHFGTSV